MSREEGWDVSSSVKIYETMTREQMLDVRWMPDNRDQPKSFYHGERIIGYTEHKTGGLYTPGHWTAIAVLADGRRVQIEEDSKG